MSSIILTIYCKQCNLEHTVYDGKILSGKPGLYFECCGEFLHWSARYKNMKEMTPRLIRDLRKSHVCDIAGENEHSSSDTPGEIVPAGENEHSSSDTPGGIVPAGENEHSSSDTRGGIVPAVGSCVKSDRILVLKKIIKWILVQKQLKVDEIFIDGLLGIWMAKCRHRWSKTEILTALEIFNIGRMDKLTEDDAFIRYTFYKKIPEHLPTPNIGWEDGAAFVSPAALNFYIGQKCEIGIWGDDFSSYTQLQNHPKGKKAKKSLETSPYFLIMNTVIHMHTLMH